MPKTNPTKSTNSQLPKRHAQIKAPSQRKKRSKEGRLLYDMITDHAMNLYHHNLFHPDMELPEKHMQTIAHHIGRMVADEMTFIFKPKCKDDKCKPKCECESKSKCCGG